MKLSRFCLLFQADCCPCDSLFILPLFGSYVNLFFEVFSSFFLLLFWEFSVASLPVGSPPCKTAFLIYHPFLLPSSTFFPFFYCSFFLNPSALFISPSRHYHWRFFLHIIPEYTSPVVYPC